MTCMAMFLNGVLIVARRRKDGCSGRLTQRKPTQTPKALMLGRYVSAVAGVGAMMRGPAAHRSACAAVSAPGGASTASASPALRNSGELPAVTEHAPSLKPPRSLWARRFSAARTVDSLHSLHSLARHIVEWAKSPNRSGRRRAVRVLPAREGETAHRNVYPDEYPTGYVHEWRNLIECWQEN